MCVSVSVCVWVGVPCGSSRLYFTSHERLLSKLILIVINELINKSSGNQKTKNYKSQDDKHSIYGGLYMYSVCVHVNKLYISTILLTFTSILPK